MPKSKNRKQHKEKLNKYKTKMKENKNSAPTMPPVRSIPTWPSNATVPLTGFEFEAIQNAIAATQYAGQILQGVMTRSILNGVVTMDFEKQDPENPTNYLPMTDEEKAPYKKEFQESIETFKKQQAALLEERNTPLIGEELPDSPNQIVNTEGEAYKEKGAKVVQLG